MSNEEIEKFLQFVNEKINQAILCDNDKILYGLEVIKMELMLERRKNNDKS